MTEDLLNKLPRKRLRFKTPHQLFQESLNRVALRPSNYEKICCATQGKSEYRLKRNLSSILQNLPLVDQNEIRARALYLDEEFFP